MPARLLALLALRETSFEEGQRAAAALSARLKRRNMRAKFFCLCERNNNKSEGFDLRGVAPSRQRREPRAEAELPSPPRTALTSEGGEGRGSKTLRLFTATIHD